MFNKQPSSAFDLERIDVAKPCGASWEAMSGNDRVRDCGQCDRKVYNIAGLSRAAAIDLIANRDGRMCIRLHRRADGTVITNDCPKGLKAYRMRIAKYAGSVFAAVLGLFSIGQAQRTQTAGDSQGMRSESSLGVARIQGIVKDLTGVTAPDAKITVTTSSGKTIVCKADKNGRFSLTSFAMERGKNDIKIEALGFNSFLDSFTIGKRETIDYQVVLEPGMIGVVVVRGEGMIDTRKSETSTTIRINN